MVLSDGYWPILGAADGRLSDEPAEGGDRTQCRAAGLGADQPGCSSVAGRRRPDAGRGRRGGVGIEHVVRRGARRLDGERDRGRGRAGVSRSLRELYVGGTGFGATELAAAVITVEAFGGLLGRAGGGAVGLVTTYGLFAAALFAAAIVGRRRSQAAG
jgi:hypothetical protein